MSEIEGEPHARKITKRARDIADDTLINLYRDHEKRGELSKLDPRVLIFWEWRWNGKRPKRKGGRPPELHRQLLIAVAVREAIKANGGKRGSTAKAIREVHETYGKRFNVKLEAIRDIHYKRDPDWLRDVGLELARRALDANADSAGTQEKSWTPCKQQQPTIESRATKEK